MKKILATGALLATQLVANGQNNKISPIGYLDISAQNHRSISKYQYSKNGVNHAVGGILGNIGNRLSFRILGQAGSYVESNYIGSDGGNIKYIHDLNFSVLLGKDNHIKIEGGIFGGSPIGQPSIIPINVQANLDSTSVPTDIITNGLLNTWTQLSENTPYYITGIFVSKHLGTWDIKIGLTNGAQHIKDNNQKLGGFSSVQFTDKHNNTHYACYHISDESSNNSGSLMHHIFEGHSAIKVNNISIVPAIYFIHNQDNTLYGGNLTASKKINPTTQGSLMAEFNHNPQETVFNSKNHKRIVAELHKTLGNTKGSSTVLAGSVGFEGNGEQFKPTFGISIKTILQ